jgi:methylmalonyl-CoA/ethylmalonyl-CoA epimerase
MDRGEAGEPLVKAMDLKITKVGIVVRDAVQTAKRYARLFGVGPWSFHDLEPTLSVLQGKPVEPVACGVRVARAELGEKRIELVQPLYGASCPMAYLWERGEGVHHLGLGAVDGYDELLTALEREGMRIETAGVLDSSRRFVQFGSWQGLGVLFEVSEPGPGLPEPWGRLEAVGQGAVDTGEKRIAQIGIVTEDAEGMARRYWDLLGIGPWLLFDWGPPDGKATVLHGVTLQPGVEVAIRAAIADHPSLQVELLEPVLGPSTHMEYLRSHGPGPHHLSFDIVDDHDEAVEALGAEGVEIEMQGLAGPAYQYTYMATQRLLGTVWEMVKFFPEEDEAAGLYGTYPPSEEGV